MTVLRVRYAKSAKSTQSAAGAARMTSMVRASDIAWAFVVS
jgi:hypothetical protein